MSLADRPDDRQAESGTAATAIPGLRTVQAMEASEDLLTIGGRDSRAVVADQEPYPASHHVHVEPDESVWGRGVPDRVHGQVAQCLGEAVGISQQGTPRHHSELEAPLREGGKTLPDLRYECLQPDRLAQQELSLLGRSQQQQVVDQPRDPADFALEQSLHPPDLLRGRGLLSGQQIQLPADHGQWGAQLVGGVGDELALGREGLLQAIEHPVEGVRQDGDLGAVAGGLGHPGPQVAAIDLCGYPRQAPQGRASPGHPRDTTPNRPAAAPRRRPEQRLE